jgi:UDP-N-acetylmuramate dehydrogenase
LFSETAAVLKMNEPLKNHTTFKIGGPAKYFAEVNEQDKLSALIKACRENSLPFFIVGAGSNILAGDHGFDGIVIKLTGDFCKYSITDTTLSAGAGTVSVLLVKKAAMAGLSGLEMLSGIPGSIGGAVFGNAGTAGEWVGQSVEEVEVLDDGSKICKFGRDELKFGYRSSNLGKYIILKTVISLKNAQKNDILKKIESLEFKRKNSQPFGDMCAGSVFKNPPEESAGRLIESAGLKGLVFGGAKVSEKHANFIANTGSATAGDVKALINIIRHKVLDKYGIELETEIKFLGK